MQTLLMRPELRIFLSPPPVDLHHISTSDGHIRTQFQRLFDHSSQPCRLTPVSPAVAKSLGPGSARKLLLSGFEVSEDSKCLR